MNQRGRRIAVILVDRANYGRLKPVMSAIQDHPELELRVICAGTMVLDRFDRPAALVEADGFPVHSKLFIELEGSTPETMARSLGIGVVEFANEFARLRPDTVLVIGDRYEALSAALAAAYMNIRLAHVQGGEVSGSIDESARHCITKLAHCHFPATSRAAQFVRQLGERHDYIFTVGCPSGDIARGILPGLPDGVFNDGVGAEIASSEPYILVVLHPVTTHFGEVSDEVQNSLDALEGLGHQVVWLWPNIDAGADHVSRVLRRYRELRRPNWLRVMKNFTPEDYLRVLAGARCAVGNSSSFVRDASFLGTPVVLVGDRQSGREVADNARTVTDLTQLRRVIQEQVAHGAFPPSTLYGDGKASERIATILASVEPPLQKRLAYADVREARGGGS